MSKEIRRWKRSRLTIQVMTGFVEWFILLPAMIGSGFLLASAALEALSSTEGTFDPAFMIGMAVIIIILFTMQNSVSQYGEKRIGQLGPQPGQLPRVVIREVVEA